MLDEAFSHDRRNELVGVVDALTGGNPRKDAVYLNFTPPKNDGQTLYKLTVKDAPVDGFWSISLYDAYGYYQKNPLNAYSLKQHHRQERCGSLSHHPIRVAPHQIVQKS